MKYLILLAIIIFSLGGCKNAPTKTTDSGVPNVSSDIKEISPAEAQTAVSRAYSQFVDIRAPEEYTGGHASRAVNIPLETLSSKLDTIERNEPVYIIDQAGDRSKKAAEMLKQAGFNNVFYVRGGTAAWQAAGLPIENVSPHSPNPKK